MQKPGSQPILENKANFVRVVTPSIGQCHRNRADAQSGEWGKAEILCRKREDLKLIECSPLQVVSRMQCPAVLHVYTIRTIGKGGSALDFNSMHWPTTYFTYTRSKGAERTSKIGFQRLVDGWPGRKMMLDSELLFLSLGTFMCLTAVPQPETPDFTRVKEESLLPMTTIRTRSESVSG